MNVIDVGEGCPAVASDEQALFLAWAKADGSLGFARAIEPQVCMR